MGIKIWQGVLLGIIAIALALPLAILIMRSPLKSRDPIKFNCFAIKPLSLQIGGRIDDITRNIIRYKYQQRFVKTFFPTFRYKFITFTGFIGFN